MKKRQIATAILAFLFAVSRFHLALLYLLFFGLHPIINHYHLKGIKKRWYLFIVKGVLFVGACYLMFFAFSMFIVENEIISSILPWFIAIIATLFYIVYDFIMIRFQKMTGSIVKRLGL